VCPAHPVPGDGRNSPWFAEIAAMDFIGIGGRTGHARVALRSFMTVRIRARLAG
jgi:hypothetical protein